MGVDIVLEERESEFERWMFVRRVERNAARRLAHGSVTISTD